MAAVAGVQAASATLTTTTVDTITLSGSGSLVTVINREPTTGTAFWVTVGPSAITPTAAGAECYPVFPTSSTSFRIAKGTGGAVVKILGNGHAYTVMLGNAPGT